MFSNDIIVALATPNSKNGAIAVIRLSGNGSINLVNSCLKKKNIDKQRNHSLTINTFLDDDSDLDDVVISIYFKGSSYTKEESVEISCHNSEYIINRIILILINNGARMADHGEFTKRAFLNGRLDITQAEAVADIIASNSKSSHDIAIQQMRGNFSSKIKDIQSDIIEIASLLELNLDFSQEYVEFTERDTIKNKLANIIKEVSSLVDSYKIGEVIKNGLPIAIVGKPNVGKSSLLNRLLKEDRAIVSPIAGTTRDTIEAEMCVDGINCRFIDTAGLRDDTCDVIEQIGVKRTRNTIEKAKLVLYLVDINTKLEECKDDIEYIESLNKDFKIVCNKIDLNDNFPTVDNGHIYISIKNDINVNKITDYISSKYVKSNNEIITNARHYCTLTQCLHSLQNAYEEMSNNTPDDLIMIDINSCIEDLNGITGQSISDEILNSIFKKFCIGK